MLFRSPAKDASLVTVTLALRGEPPLPEFQEEWSRDSRSLLERCLLPDLDVLLPRTHTDGVIEQFFVAAFADDVGTSVLVNRIRGQFERYGHLEDTGLTLSIGFTALPRRENAPELSTDMLVSTLVSDLETAIESQILLGAVQHE